MAVIWMDGFDHYGATATGRTAMLDGVYAELSNTMYPVTTNPRTGAHSLSFPGQGVARRVLGAARATVGTGYAYYSTSLPTQDQNGTSGTVLMSFRNAGNAANITIGMTTTGQITVRQGSAAGTLIHTTATPVIVAGAYQHIEMKLYSHVSAGTLEIRVNGVTVVSLTGINSNSATGEVAQLAFTGGVSGHAAGVLIDDWFAWDDAGTENNDFLGDRRVRTLFPNGNTASAGWTAVGAASGYLCIDEAAPNDETDYLEAAGGTTPTSEFDFEDLPAVGAVSAVQTYVRMRKTNAGTANAQVSLVSGASVDAGTDRPITEAYTYYMDVSELDPATGVPWTQSAVNSAKLRIARTA